MHRQVDQAHEELTDMVTEALKAIGEIRDLGTELSRPQPGGP